MTKSLAVPLYHYIRDEDNSIAVSIRRFESHLAALKKAGWRGVGLDEAASYLIGQGSLPPKSLLITFDDGFLCTYQNAWPLLEAYGHKAVVFAVTGKVEEDQLRPTLADARDGRTPLAALPPVVELASSQGGFGCRRDRFFSWIEARRMEMSGVMRIEGHSALHRSVFTSPTYEGFFMPGDRGRTFDRVDSPILWGLPHFERGPAMSNRAFMPSARLTEAIGALVPQEPLEAAAFIGSSRGREQIERCVQALPVADLGRLETESEYEERVRRELTQCRDDLEQRLGRPPLALAWPWGASTPKARAIAQELGFKLLFDTANGPNHPGQPATIRRFKARNKPASWLVSRVKLYSRPMLATIYSRIKRSR